MSSHFSPASSGVCVSPSGGGKTARFELSRTGCGNEMTETEQELSHSRNNENGDSIKRKEHFGGEEST